MKKLISFMLALTLLALVGCGSGNSRKADYTGSYALVRGEAHTSIVAWWFVEDDLKWDSIELDTANLDPYVNPETDMSGSGPVLNDLLGKLGWEQKLLRIMPISIDEAGIRKVERKNVPIYMLVNTPDGEEVVIKLKYDNPLRNRKSVLPTGSTLFSHFDACIADGGEAEELLQPEGDLLFYFQRVFGQQHLAVFRFHAAILLLRQKFIALTGMGQVDVEVHHLQVGVLNLHQFHQNGAAVLFLHIGQQFGGIVKRHRLVSFSFRFFYCTGDTPAAQPFFAPQPYRFADLGAYCTLNKRERSNIMHAQVHEKTCICCGLCPSICPEVFSLEDGESARAITDPIPDELRLGHRKPPTAALSALLRSADPFFTLFFAKKAHFFEIYSLQVPSGVIFF